MLRAQNPQRYVQHADLQEMPMSHHLHAVAHGITENHTLRDCSFGLLLMCIDTYVICTYTYKSTYLNAFQIIGFISSLSGGLHSRNSYRAGTSYY